MTIDGLDASTFCYDGLFFSCAVGSADPPELEFNFDRQRSKKDCYGIHEEAYHADLLNAREVGYKTLRRAAQEWKAAGGARTRTS